MSLPLEWLISGVIGYANVATFTYLIEFLMMDSTFVLDPASEDSYLRAVFAKWPNVPACRGWLHLDARGNWWMRDDKAQQTGKRGSRIFHPGIIAFIERYYFRESETGEWFFQNGPQKVYVSCELAPNVARVSNDLNTHTLSWQTHCGKPFVVAAWYEDARQHLYVEDSSHQLLASVHPQDLIVIADAFEATAIPPRAMLEPSRFFPTSCLLGALEA